MATVTPPAAGDLAGLTRPSSPNNALAGPVGFEPAPDVTTPAFDVAPERLFKLAEQAISGRARTTPLARHPERLRADFVARSLVFRFADVIEMQAVATGGGSALIVYSHSLQGYYDFGVNRRRVDAIVSQVEAAVRSGAAS